MEITFVLFILAVFFIELPSARSYLAYNIIKECNTTIALNDTGGDLYLDPSILSRMMLPNGKCTVGIQAPPQYDILFYFTEFSVGVSDMSTNVSIRGALGDNFKRNRMPLQELPDDLNGYNQSLIYKYFAVEDTMTVTFQTSFAWRDSSSSFFMKFIFFYVGNCQDEGLSQCTNGRCVPETLFCNDTVNACGTDFKECVVEKTFWDTISEALESIGTYIAIAICCYVVLAFLNIQRKRYGGVKNIPVIRRVLKFAGCENHETNNETQLDHSHDPDNISIASPENVEFTERLSLNANEANVGTYSPPEYHTYNPYNVQTNQDSSGVAFLVDAPNDNNAQQAAPPLDVNHLPPMDNTPLPPPSYSDVMSNQTKYLN